MRGIHGRPVNSPHKWPVTQKCFHLMTSSWYSGHLNHRENGIAPTCFIPTSLRPRDAYMRHQNRPSLILTMACRLFGAKPISEPMQDYCQWEHIIAHGNILLPMGTYFSEIWIKMRQLLLKKMHLKLSSAKCRPSCLGLNMFIIYDKLCHSNDAIKAFWAILYRNKHFQRV